MYCHTQNDICGKFNNGGNVTFLAGADSMLGLTLKLVQQNMSHYQFQGNLALGWQYGVWPWSPFLVIFGFLFILTCQFSFHIFCRIRKYTL
jgi:hypothetical protein